MLPADIRDKRILISPLNWGMGHVSRCIPLVDKLLKNNNTLFFAGDSSQLSVIRQYFSNINLQEHEGYPFDFGKGNFRFGMLKQFPDLIQRLKKERAEVERLCVEHAIDIIISDHRYGFHSDRVHSIFLTHQVRLPLRWYEGAVQRLHRNWMRKFNEIWVVDDEQLNFAGQLSKTDADLPISYIGVLSRFQLYQETKNRMGGTVIIVSGPRPFSVNFAKEQAKKYELDEVTMIVPNDLSELRFNSSVKIVRSDDWKYCDELILNASKIVSRSGYSTLMDLVQLKVPFSITPTPGQSEQEYLFKYWGERMKQ